MKQALVVAILLFAASNELLAQGGQIHTRWGGSGSHTSIPAGTTLFAYEATVTGVTAPYEIKLEVYHNAVLTFSDSALVSLPTTSYQYNSPVDMASWGLRGGDTVTFVLKLIDSATGAVLASHSLIGDVCGT